MWLNILRRQVEAKSMKQVAGELGKSVATVSTLLAGKYGASTARMEALVMSIYGGDGVIACPVSGEVTPAACAERWSAAKRVGLGVGNPDTMRLHWACLRTCGVRK